MDSKTITKIINLINKNGRQGPKDLKSNEVFNWVTSGISLTYSEYLKILNENSIKYTEREKIRNAYFIIDKKGKYQLFKSNEEEIRKYLCYIVRENPNITSAKAKIKFKTMYRDYTYVDLMDQKNLSSKQDIIDQTIRNILTSNIHKKKNAELFNQSEKQEGKEFTYTLKEKGYEYAQQIENKIQELNEKDKIEESKDTISEYVLKGISTYSNDELKLIHEANKKFYLFDDYADFLSKVKNKSSYRFPTDSKIKLTRLNQINFKCEIDENHKTFPCEALPNYLEGHHLVPMAAQKNFTHTKLDCIENMVGLCPICHAQITFGTKEAKKEIFDKIVDKRIKGLESIGFTKEILDTIFDMYY